MGKSTSKSLAIGNPADLGANHVEHHSKERRYLQRGDAPTETLHGKHLASVSEIYDDTMELAYQQGMMNQDEWHEWNEQRALKRGRKNVHANYSEYKESVSAKVAKRMTAKEKAVQVKNDGMAFESGLYYVSSVEDYYRQGLVDEKRNVLDPDKLQQHRKFEGETFKSFYNSDEYQILHKDIESRAEIHYGEDGAVHLQTLGVMGSLKNNKGKTQQFEISPTKVKEERLRELLGDDVFEEELYREKVIQGEKTRSEGFVPTREVYASVNMENSFKVPLKGVKGEAGRNQLVKQVWWRVHQDKLEDIALEKSKEHGVEWQRDYSDGKKQPTRSKKEYGVYIDDKLLNDKRENDLREGFAKVNDEVAKHSKNLKKERTEVDDQKAINDSRDKELRALQQQLAEKLQTVQLTEKQQKQIEKEQQQIAEELRRKDESLRQERLLNEYLADERDQKIKEAVESLSVQFKRVPTEEETDIELLRRSMIKHNEKAVAESKNKPENNKGSSGYNLN